MNIYKEAIVCFCFTLFFVCGCATQAPGRDPDDKNVSESARKHAYNIASAAEIHAQASTPKVLDETLYSRYESDRNIGSYMFGYRYINEIGDIPNGYATYSYVIAGRGPTDERQSKRYKALVSAIKESTLNVSNKKNTEKNRTNLFILPWDSASSNWNVDLSLSLATLLIEADKKFLNPGPFIVTFYDPINTLNKNKKNMLFVDLTNIRPEAMREVVSIYKNRLINAPLIGIEQLKSIKLALLNAALILEENIGFAKVAYADFTTTLTQP